MSCENTIGSGENSTKGIQRSGKDGTSINITAYNRVKKEVCEIYGSNRDQKKLSV